MGGEGTMIIQPGTVIIEDNHIRINSFKVTSETTIKEGRLAVLCWAAEEIKAAIESEKD